MKDLVRVSWLQFNGPDIVQVYQAFRNLFVHFFLWSINASAITVVLFKFAVDNDTVS